jgi:hypothetical protein
MADPSIVAILKITKPLKQSTMFKETRPKWCRDKTCKPLHAVRECCVGKLKEAVIHDGEVNDMAFCVDDASNCWAVCSRDLRVLLKVVFKVLRDRGQLPDWFRRYLNQRFGQQE